MMTIDNSHSFDGSHAGQKIYSTFFSLFLSLKKKERKIFLWKLQQFMGAFLTHVINNDRRLLVELGYVDSCELQKKNFSSFST